MELASARLLRGQIPWRGLLLTASLLTYWSPLTTAQVTVDAVPPNVVEENSVLLLAHNMPQEFQVFYWYKVTTTGLNSEIARYIRSSNTSQTEPAYSGRVTIYSNGSLFFQNVNKTDEGPYTLSVIDKQFNPIQTSVQFRVYPALQKPNVTGNNSNPMEGEPFVSLMCEPYTNNTSYLWSRNGESLSEGDRVTFSEGNRTLTLLNVRRTDKGYYECEARNPATFNRSDPFNLDVIYGPDAPVISPPDIYLHQGSNLNLSCHADSNPPAQYFWLINEKLQTSSQELFISNITTNNSGTYACFVNNTVTGLSRTTVKNITVFEPVTQPSIQITNTTVKELGSVTLTCFSKDTGVSVRWLFNSQSLQLTDRMTLSQDNSTLRIDPIKREDAGDYQCEISNPVSFRISHPIKLDVIPDPTQGNSGLSEGAIAGIVIGSVAGVALIAALAYFLYSRKTGGSGSF